MGSWYASQNSDCECDYDCDSDWGYDVRDRKAVELSRDINQPRELESQVERARRGRVEEADPDEYAMVPVKPKRSYEETEKKAIMSPQETQENEMGQLKLEEQKIKNKIATERLTYDVQKRQQSKELHEIKMAVLKKYPNIMFNKQPNE